MTGTPGGGMAWQAYSACPAAGVLTCLFKFYSGRGEASRGPCDRLAQGPRGRIN